MPQRDEENWADEPHPALSGGLGSAGAERGGVASDWLGDAIGSHGAATPNTATPNADVNPVHLLERGECTVAEFEEIFAARLIRTDGGVVNPEGLLGRMLAAGDTPVTAMYDLIRALRGKGVRTGLLSNS